MPAPGDQHTPWANPFDEAKPQVAGWTAREIGAIAAKLDKQLGPEYISSRAGPGGLRVHYLTAEKCIGLANEVFGFNGWSSSIQNIQVDFADENAQTQRVSIGLSVIVRITLRDGTYHEDIGYGSIENARGKAVAFEKAKKEGTTDALKRALRSFGNVLGNCVYNPDYVRQVTKVKAHPVRKFDQEKLHRHADFTKGEPVKSEDRSLDPPPLVAQAEMVDSFEDEDLLGDFDEADFCVPEDAHPAEVVVRSPPHLLATDQRLVMQQQQQQQQKLQQQQQQQQPSAARPIDRLSAADADAAVPSPRTPTGPRPPAAADLLAPGPAAGPIKEAQGRAASPRPGPPPGGGFEGPSSNSSNSSSGPGPGPETVAFFSARSINPNPEPAAQGGPRSKPASGPSHHRPFNPKTESPSIRKTPGIDHSSSRPVARNGQHVPPPPPVTQAPAPAAPGPRPNLINPSLDPARRIGAPGGFRSPTVRRPPLADVAANTLATTTTMTTPAADASVPAKRPRMC